MEEYCHRLPTFVGIGAQRTATTWIYQCLKEHPEVFVPEVKEINFFNQHYSKGINWYKSLFQVQAQHKAIGEISPIYLSNHLAIQRMASDIPSAQLFVVIRHPILRAYSAYELHQKRYPDGFCAACEERPDYLIDWGLYAKHLKRVFSLYDKTSVKVLLYDDLQHNPEQFLAELFSFLHVDESFRPDCIQTRYNRVMYPRTQNLLRMFGMTKIIETLKNTTFGERIRSRHASNRQDPLKSIDAGKLRWLKCKFRDDILELQDLIDRDLSDWL